MILKVSDDDTCSFIICDKLVQVVVLDDNKVTINGGPVVLPYINGGLIVYTSETTAVSSYVLAAQQLCSF